MRLSYNKLWKLLIDKNLSKKELAEKYGVGIGTITSIINSKCQFI
jgi:DNA-binding Xre family transcriptional regulator